jgi:hypothetical protein
MKRGTVPYHTTNMCITKRMSRSESFPYRSPFDACVSGIDDESAYNGR